MDCYGCLPLCSGENNPTCGKKDGSAWVFNQRPFLDRALDFFFYLILVLSHSPQPKREEQTWQTFSLHMICPSTFHSQSFGQIESVWPKAKRKKRTQTVQRCKGRSLIDFFFFLMVSCRRIATWWTMSKTGERSHWLKGWGGIHFEGGMWAIRPIAHHWPFSDWMGATAPSCCNVGLPLSEAKAKSKGSRTVKIPFI